MRWIPVRQTVYARKASAVFQKYFYPKGYLKKTSIKKFLKGIHCWCFLWELDFVQLWASTGATPNSGRSVGACRHPWRAGDFPQALSCCIEMLLSPLREAHLDPTSYEKGLREGQTDLHRQPCVIPSLVGEQEMCLHTRYNSCLSQAPPIVIPSLTLTEVTRMYNAYMAAA